MVSLNDELHGRMSRMAQADLRPIPAHVQPRAVDYGAVPVDRDLTTAQVVYAAVAVWYAEYRPDLAMAPWDEADQMTWVRIVIQIREHPEPPENEDFVGRLSRAIVLGMA